MLRDAPTVPRNTGPGGAVRLFVKRVVLFLVVLGGLFLSRHPLANFAAALPGPVGPPASGQMLRARILAEQANPSARPHHVFRALGADRPTPAQWRDRLSGLVQPEPPVDPSSLRLGWGLRRRARWISTTAGRCSVDVVSADGLVVATRLDCTGRIADLAKVARGLAGTDLQHVGLEVIWGGPGLAAAQRKRDLELDIPTQQGGLEPSLLSPWVHDLVGRACGAGGSPSMAFDLAGNLADDGDIDTLRRALRAPVPAARLAALDALVQLETEGRITFSDTEQQAIDEILASRARANWCSGCMGWGTKREADLAQEIVTLRRTPDPDILAPRADPVDPD